MHGYYLTILGDRYIAGMIGGYDQLPELEDACGEGVLERGGLLYNCIGVQMYRCTNVSVYKCIDVQNVSM